jgi:hypothetical protein
MVFDLNPKKAQGGIVGQFPGRTVEPVASIQQSAKT